jgi:hypothetical protein
MLTDIQIKDYTEKSFVILGNTKDFSKDLKDFGGKWNPNLKCGPGWIFSKIHRDKVQDYISIKNNKKEVVEEAHKMLSFFKEVSSDITQKYNTDKEEIFNYLTNLWNEKYNY